VSGTSPTPPVIDSPANPRLRAALKLRERRERDATGRTLVDGAREVGRAAAAGAAIETAFVCRDLAVSPDAVAALDRLERAGVALVDVSARAFARLAFGDRADGIVAVVGVPSLALERLALPADPLVLVVEAVEKPGNLGAILRTADGAGVDAVVAADPRTDPFNPNAVRASLGTIFRVPLAAAPSGDVRGWLERAGIRIVAARADAATAHTAADLTGPLAIVLGAEATGLGGAWSDDADGVRIPMAGIADSLNVAAAAAVLAYEARRQRDERGASPT
jgi:TrmH family RNA methyltransferase